MADTQKETVDSVEDEIQAAMDELEGKDVEKEEVEEVEDDEEVEESVEESVDEPDDETEVIEEEAEEERLEAPQHWSQSDREVFNNISRDGQEFLLRRHKEMEADYTRGKQEISGIKRKFDAISDALEPHRASFEAAGLDEAGAVRQLAHWDQALRHGGREALLRLAQVYNIDLTPPESDEDVDPQVRGLQAEIQQLKQFTSQQVHEAQRARRDQIARTIDTFRTEKDASGALTHPHFDELEPQITKLFTAGLCSDLADGYQKALALRPDLKSPPKETTQKVDVDRAAKVRKAKKAATGVKSSGAVAKKSGVNLSIEDEIREAIRASG